MSEWTTSDIPDLRGKAALVTGTTSGIGQEVARQLLAHGATVLAGTRRGDDARSVPSTTTPLQIDMANMDSIRRGTAAVRDTTDRLDLLIHCAGIMATPFRKTTDGFELQLATNYLGPMLLTHELLPLLKAADQARVVIVGSPEAMLGKINLENLNLEASYSWPEAYRQSKLADVMVAFELNERATAAGSNLISVAAHPGFTNTRIITSGLKESGDWWRIPFMRLMRRLLAQPVSMGALPILYAATSDDAIGGRYYGPDGKGGLRGYPTEIAFPPVADDATLRKQLWEKTESLLGIQFDFAGQN